MYAIIDVGSNTVRLNIYRLEYGQLTQVLNRKEAVGLSSYVKNGNLMPSGIRRVSQVLKECRILVEDLQIEEVHAFATAAIRNARNCDEAVKEISKISGLKLQVISGETEAELDFLGVFHAADHVSNGLLVDVGGGSAELVTYTSEGMSHVVDLPCGSLNTYDSYVENILPTKKERKEIKAAVLSELAKLPEEFDKGPYPMICGVGGTARAMKKLAVEMFHLPAETSSIRITDLGKIIKRLENTKKGTVPSDALDVIVRCVPYRVRTLLPGMIILHTVAKFFGCESIEVTEAGVREGYLYKFVLNEQKGKQASGRKSRARRTSAKTGGRSQSRRSRSRKAVAAVAEAVLDTGENTES